MRYHRLSIKASDLPALGRRRPSITRASKEDRTVDGIPFDSKAEASRYVELRDMQRWGQQGNGPRWARYPLWFSHQPLFWLAGVKYHADFLIVWSDGTTTVEEIKSKNAKKRPDWTRLRRNIVQAKTLRNVDVEVVER